MKIRDLVNGDKFTLRRTGKRYIVIDDKWRPHRKRVKCLNENHHKQLGNIPIDFNSQCEVTLG